MKAPALGSEVHVWQVALDAPPRRESLLSAEEQARAARFRFARDRDRFVAARGALRERLGAYLEGDPAALVLKGGQGEKPRLGGPHAGALRFNLSHSADVALIAVSRDRELGVDLEAHQPVKDLAALLGVVCTAREAAAIMALPPAHREAAFLRCFTRKEALTKAWGLGLGAPLQRFEVGLEAGWLPLDGCPEPAAAWSLMDLEVEGFAAALAIAGAPPAVRFWRL